MIVELYKTGHLVNDFSSEYVVLKFTISKWIKQISPITSLDDKDLTLELNIIQSFSRKGCTHDNAYIESFHGTLKKKELYPKTYVNFEQPKIVLFQYI